MIKKTFASMVVLVTIVIIVCFSLVTTIVFHYFDRLYDTKLENELIYISRGVEYNGIEYLQGVVPENCRITWVAEDGSVIFDNAAMISSMENHSQREEIQEAFATGRGDSVRYSDTMAQKTKYLATLMEDGTVIRVSTASNTILHMFAEMMKPLLVIFFATLVVAALFAYRVSRKIVEPLEDLDLEHPELVDTYEELTPFLRRIEQQNQQIRTQMQELKRQQTEFTAITENMMEGFLVLDAQQKILSYNHSALQLLGIAEPMEAIAYKNALELNRSESFQKAISIALTGKHNEQTMKAGGRVYNIFANPVFLEETVTGAIVVIMDVTEKEQRESLRREFTANVSHELKTPLTSISGTAEIMKNGMVKPEDMSYFSGMIYKEAQRLITLVGDILKLSKLEETGMTTEKVEVDLSYLTEYILDTLKVQGEKKGVTIHSQIESNCHILGILSVADEIIYNLCENAIKYNKEGGQVFVSLKKENQRPVLIVEDTGIGIPYQEQSRVFERFYRVDKSHSKEIGGTGLGLSIVKHGVLTLGADIQLESQEGVGTKITVRF